MRTGGYPALLKKPDQVRFALIEYSLRKTRLFQQENIKAIRWLQENQHHFPLWDENDRQFLTEFEI